MLNLGTALLTENIPTLRMWVKGRLQAGYKMYLFVDEKRLDHAEKSERDNRSIFIKHGLTVLPNLAVRPSIKPNGWRPNR